MKKQYLHIILTSFLTFISHATQGATLSVPSQYTTLNAAAGAANDGDEILIEAGEYTGGGIIATLTQNNLTIRGVNGRAHLNATGVTISNGKGILVIGGSNVLIENIEFSHADVPDNNGAGIRYQGRGSITIRNCYFHHNEDGILTGNLELEEITIESCEFHDHGKSNNGFSHNIYIGRGKKFTLIREPEENNHPGYYLSDRHPVEHPGQLDKYYFPLP